MQFNNYEPDDFYDELFTAKDQPRPAAAKLIENINALPPGELQKRQQLIENTLLQQGVTFKVKTESETKEQVFPLDIIPRLVTAIEWKWLEQGLKQRIQALNLFLQDIYHQQQILTDGVMPREVVESSQGWLKPCQGLQPPGGIWCHVTGTDLVRDCHGQWYVLEDNLRIPSGVSYALANRRVMHEICPELFKGISIQPADNYPRQLLKTLQQVAPEGMTEPTVVLLTTGTNNSAYFEHSYLAAQMGVKLVECRDLVIADGYLQMHTLTGLQRVDVVYRRIDDYQLDPLVFAGGTEPGVPGLMEVYRAGKVAIANAAGTGIADDKIIYTYVPKMIRYYLDEDPILPNVDTYLCWEPEQQDYVLSHLDQLVIKPASESGGSGMLIGSTATPAARQDFAQRIKAKPRNYIAQSTLSLSRVPALLGDRLEGCHVDLRPFILYGEEIYVYPGGLTRVALKKGSLVVNSSQGGGSKDTWILAES